MGKYKIEKDVSIESVAKFPLSEMEIGNSFLIAEKEEARKLRNSLGAFYKTKAGKGKRFMTKKTEDGVRVWRTI
jgi:hypothetical protein